jgi:hypothetical protein
MQQRRLRLGDIVDDYCPRERRVTNHAIVALIEDDIRQTRCATCDTEHEYKQGKMPTLRRKKESVSAAYSEVLAAVKAEAPVPAAPSPVVQAREAARAADAAEPEQPVLPVPSPTSERIEVVQDGDPHDGENGDESDDTAEGRVHRRLIRAQLPRPENHQVVRPVPEFTMRQPAGRPGKFRGGMTRGMGGRPGAPRGGGHSNANGNTRTPAFGRGATGRGGAGQAGRPGGRSEGPRHPRGGQPARPGKKHSK